MDYLPKDATIEQACNWLKTKTGQTWILPRLLECHLTPHFWLDYKPGYPAIYGDRIEGYQTRMMFQGDLCRLESDGSDALVNMFAAHDDSLIKTEPGIRVPLSELRFKRENVERVAEIINNTAPAQNSATPAPFVAMEAQRGYVLALPSGQTHVQFGELADLIADALWPDMGTNDTRMTYGCTRVNLDAELVRAVKAGTLQVKDPLTFGPHTFPVGHALLSALVTVDDLREFVAGRGLTVETAKTQATTPSPAPAMDVGVSDGVEPGKAGPLPLTTGDIAFCFAGLRWNEQEWRKPLGDKPKWLAPCIAIPGVRGVSQRRWNPVLIGAALEREGHAKQNSIRARFQTMPQLASWRDAWKTYEADNFDTE